MLTCIVAKGPEITTPRLDIDDNGLYQTPQCVHPRVVSLASVEASGSFEYWLNGGSWRYKTADSQLAEARTLMQLSVSLKINLKNITLFITERGRISETHPSPVV